MEALSVDGMAYLSRIGYPDLRDEGQRLLVAYGNDIMTRYAYDPDNFRLMRQRSEGYAHAVSSGTHTYAYQSGTLRQDNEYEYDLAGNIVWMKDGRGDSAAGGSGMLTRDFEYDPLYRLLHDTGRESTSYTQAADPSVDLGVATGVANTRAYNRYYLYDRLGNMLQVSHVASGNTFNRDFNGYDVSGNPNPYEGGNLATGIDYGGTTVNYTFDDNGNMLTEGSSRHMEWDFGDQMRAYYTQAGTSEPTVYAHYLYGADGSRVKKLVRKSAGNEEVTVYIDGGFEYLYELDGSTREEEMNEIHVMDGRSRIARVQVYGGTWTGSTADPVLYNLEEEACRSSFLGHSSFTLTDTGGAYSQEEYFPFGETSFGSYAKKRYRFCGKERDGESGLYYYGARYYAPWSCRFVSIDPLAGKYPFYTPYQYAGNQPIISMDVDGLEGDNQNNGQKRGGVNASGDSGSDWSLTKHQQRRKESGKSYWKYKESVAVHGMFGISHRKSKFFVAGTVPINEPYEIAIGRGHKWSGWPDNNSGRAWGPGDIVYDKTYYDVLSSEQDKLEFDYKLGVQMQIQVFVNDQEIYKGAYNNLRIRRDPAKHFKNVEMRYDLRPQDITRRPDLGWGDYHKVNVRILVTAFDPPRLNLRYDDPFTIFKYKFRYKKVVNYAQIISAPKGYNPNKKYEGQEQYRKDHDVYFFW